MASFSSVASASFSSVADSRRGFQGIPSQVVGSRPYNGSSDRESPPTRKPKRALPSPVHTLGPGCCVERQSGVETCMSMRPLRSRVRESGKLSLRTKLGRVGVSVGRDPYQNRLQRTLAAFELDFVLDVGANIGQFGHLLRCSGFQGSIHSVEPLRDAYPLLRRRCARDANWTCSNEAVGASPGKGTINVSENSYSSSLLRMTPLHLEADPTSRVVEVQEVQITTVVSLMQRLNRKPQSTLLKIDTQGYEASVLSGAQPLLDSISAVQLEISFVELYAGQELFQQVIEEMNAVGLELWSLDPGISDSAGRLLQCDALFVRVGRAQP